MIFAPRKILSYNLALLQFAELREKTLSTLLARAHNPTQNKQWVLAGQVFDAGANKGK